MPNTINTCNYQMVSGGCALKVTSNLWVNLYLLTEACVILFSVSAVIISFINPKLSRNNKAGNNVVNGVNIFIYLILGFIAAITLFFTSALAIASYHGEKDIAYIQSQYYKAFDNNSLRYAYLSCIDVNIDTPDYCAFTLDTSLPQQDVTNLTTKLESEGYSVQSKTTSGYQRGQNVNSTQYTATNAETNMNFYYSADIQDGQIHITVSRASNPYN